MSEHRRSHESRVDEAGLEELLRETGSRIRPPSDVTREIYDNVYAEWRGIVAQRRRRRSLLLAAAASVVMAAGLAVFMVPRFEPTKVAVGSVVRVAGEVTRSSDDSAGHGFAVGDPMYAGDEIATDAGGRASLDFGSGLSVRVDGDSRIRLARADRLELVRGAVYVDARPGTGSAADLVIDTSVGSVRHQGTQYEVRDVGDAIRISVREGRVVFSDRTTRHIGAAGEQLLVRTEGEVIRGTVPPDDARWDWAVRIAPPFDIENQPLSEFLAWAARETGRSVEFASPAARQVAETTVLRGSIADLDPEAALAAVLATTELQMALQDGRGIHLSLDRSE